MSSTEVITSETQVSVSNATVPSPLAKSCRPGFEPLLNVDTLFVKQKWTDRLVNDQNQFKILTENGDDIFTAFETTDGTERLLRASRQSEFSLQIGEILSLKGTIGTNCCRPGSVVVFSKRQPLGSVVQTGYKCSLDYEIRDRRGVTGITLEAGQCSNFGGCMACCTSKDFSIFNNSDGNRERIGSICKIWGGGLRELATNADQFRVKFPKDLDVTYKAFLIAATILIDFQYYERPT